MDDIRHMEVSFAVFAFLFTSSKPAQEMEKERVARAAEEQDRAERAKKTQEQFDDSKGQWEKDKSDIHKLAMKDVAEEKAGDNAEEKTSVSSTETNSEENAHDPVAPAEKEPDKAA